MSILSGEGQPLLLIALLFYFWWGVQLVGTLIWRFGAFGHGFCCSDKSVLRFGFLTETLNPFPSLRTSFNIGSLIVLIFETMCDIRRTYIWYKMSFYTHTHTHTHTRTHTAHTLHTHKLLLTYAQAHYTIYFPQLTPTKSTYRGGGSNMKPGGQESGALGAPAKKKSFFFFNIYIYIYFY